MDIGYFLKLMTEKGASDMFLTTGAPVNIKVKGKLYPLGNTGLPGGMVKKIAYSLMDEGQVPQFEKNLELNMAIAVKDAGRFRINVFKQRGEVGMVIRAIKSEIPTIEQLRLPPLVLLYLQVLVAIVVLFPLFAASEKTGLTAQNIPLVLYACLLASMVAPLAWMQAVVRLGPSRTTLFFNLLPVITALIAAAVLHEQLAMYHMVGGLLTLGGVILSERWTTVLGRKLSVA